MLFGYSRNALNKHLSYISYVLLGGNRATQTEFFWEAQHVLFSKLSFYYVAIRFGDENTPKAAYIIYR